MTRPGISGPGSGPGTSDEEDEEADRAAGSRMGATPASASASASASLRDVVLEGALGDMAERKRSDKKPRPPDGTSFRTALPAPVRFKQRVQRMQPTGTTAGGRKGSFEGVRRKGALQKTSSNGGCQRLDSRKCASSTVCGFNFLNILTTTTSCFNLRVT